MDMASYDGRPMRRWPAAQIIRSLSPHSSASTQADSAVIAEVVPLSMAAAPPIEFHVFTIREASVLVLKLPVSSINAGQCFSKVSS